MAILLNNVANYLSKAIALVTGFPLSFSGWINISSYTNFPHVLNIDDGTTSNDFACYIDNFNAPLGNVAAESNQGGTHESSTTTAAITLNAWQHVAMVIAALNSRSSYLNGGNKGTATTSLQPVGLNTTRLGSYPGGLVMNGSLAFVGIWNVALSDADVFSLFAGASPRMIQPQNLIAYVRATGALGQDLVSTPWTINGSPSESPNPRIYLP